MLNNHTIGQPTQFSPKMNHNPGGLPIHGQIPNDFSGSQGQSMGNGNYIKHFDNGSDLHVHAPNGIVTGAKLINNGNETTINNTQAALMDTLPGIVKVNTTGQR